MILTNNAKLEAKGSDAIGSNNTGGGGGGVISITTTTFVGRVPNVTIATAGGKGWKDGESGVVIVGGIVCVEIILYHHVQGPLLTLYRILY